MTASPLASAHGVFTVAVVGAESTGKSQLVQALRATAARTGFRCHSVDEHLRAWVDTHQRTPQAHEQTSIANAQTEAAQQAHSQLAALAAPNEPRLLLLDTHAAMTAAYSAYYFNDKSLWDMAFAAQPAPQLVLLMGLDLPWQADGLQRDGQAAQRGVDQLLRDALQQRSISFQVVYGQGALRHNNAWQAITTAFAAHQRSDAGHAQAGPGAALNFHAWGCEDCSDPDCERRLFKGLF